MRRLSQADRDSVEAEIVAGAKATWGYYALLVGACGVATLGLLQSSAAVVIGAMLISPLMGPILGMGLALALVKPNDFRRAAIALALGAILSVLAGAVIVWISPIAEATPEILARTRPTLLDLAVAVMSGLVAAFVTLTRRGGVIAGVAIATALMPPLAVTGYGLASGDLGIAGGSFLLFMTNVVAILGCVFVVARAYGFRPARRKRARWEEIVLASAFLLLALPLGFSLRDIAVEARQSLRAKAAIQRAFAPDTARVEDVRVTIERGTLSKVRAVVITDRFVAGLPGKLQAALGRQVSVDVQQILTADAELARADRSALANDALAGKQAMEATPETRLRTLLEDAATVDSVRDEGGMLVATIKLKGEGGLTDYRTLETVVARLMPQAQVRLVPPPRPLDPIPFASGRSELDPAGQQAVEAAAWALQRWGIREVRVTGLADSRRARPSTGERRVALARGQSVAAALAQLGITVSDVTGMVEPAGRNAAPWRAVIQPAPAAKAE
ncbi:DUF389 domain-containing protein [Sphingomonas sp.]|uniref:DUF389 domain-containing protein n=1 Tax=Sphingomonas sp. TaxID=28214 RepID=UPI001B08CE1F|nr:DUF389 domain-containing protein [Sphingomonas sp.]MBO9712444.1 DUF389 domain-containing protein [Sphingomonas sp.]